MEDILEAMQKLVKEVPLTEMNQSEPQDANGKKDEDAEEDEEDKDEDGNSKKKRRRKDNDDEDTHQRKKRAIHSDSGEDQAPKTKKKSTAKRGQGKRSHHSINKCLLKGCKYNGPEIQRHLETHAKKGENR